jgi:hypothetical protein
MEPKGVNIKLLGLLLTIVGGISADQVRISNLEHRVDKVEVFMSADEDRRVENQKLKDDVAHMSEKIDEIAQTLKEMQGRK